MRLIYLYVAIKGWTKERKEKNISYIRLFHADDYDWTFDHICVIRESKTHLFAPNRIPGLFRIAGKF